ncbi:uncharacterized protein LOC133821235 [Humulus lupulus]|uniref:uncharacterized protein LOC133821235 n=1 Tax=Humulus lupulus TaxID=3486 RepID=UPI002B40A93C|nr:uncharacterized protein LOC133821235 [Humulus lupulus]
MTKQTEWGKVTRIDAFRRAHTKKNGEPINQTISEVFGGKATTSEGQSHNIPQSNNIPSPKSVGIKNGHNFTKARNSCYLLDWSDAIIAEGHWDSSDPDLEVHRIPLGPDFMRVWVDVAVVPSAYLFCPNYAMLTIREAVGSTVAWPSQKVIP